MSYTPDYTKETDPLKKIETFFRDMWLVEVNPTELLPQWEEIQKSYYLQAQIAKKSKHV